MRMSEFIAPVSIPRNSDESSQRLMHQQQLIAAHSAVSGLEHALRFAPPVAAAVFRDMVWLLDGLGAVQLDGEPVWVQTLVEEPNHPGVIRAEKFAQIAKTIADADVSTPVTQLMALNVAEKLSNSAPSGGVTLRRDANSNEALQHGLAHWEQFISDSTGAASDADPLVMASIADAKLRRLSPFTANNHASSSLMFGAVLRDEQVLNYAPLCLSNFFSRHAKEASALIERLEALIEHIALCRETIEDTLSRAPVEVVMHAVCRPVCTNADLMDAGISRRQTSASYLKKLEAVGLLRAHPKGKELRYVNPGVMDAFVGLG